MTQRWIRYIIILGLMIYGLSIQVEEPPPAYAQLDLDNNPANLRPEEIPQEWMQLLHEYAGEIGLTLPTATRIIAYSSIALYEAVVSTQSGQKSLSPNLIGLPEIPQPDGEVAYDWATVANGTLSTVLGALLVEAADHASGRSNVVQRAVDGLRIRQTRLRQLALARESQEIFDRSLAWGDQVGGTILAWAKEDGYVLQRNRPFGVPTGNDAFWHPMPRDATPIQPYWGLLRLFVLNEVQQCDTPLQMPFGIQPDTTFYKQALELYEMQGKLTKEQAEIASFWGQEDGETGLNVTHWMMIVNQIIEQQGLTLTEGTKLYALVGLALADTAIATWHQAYAVFLIGPQSYINRYIDPEWTPYLSPLNSPEYPASQAAFGAAASEVLMSLLGGIYVVDKAGTVKGENVKRLYTSLEAMAYENGLAALYGGLHFRASVEAGLRQGECVAQQVIAKTGITLLD